jgi:hypothetical protein
MRLRGERESGWNGGVEGESGGSWGAECAVRYLGVSEGWQDKEQSREKTRANKVAIFCLSGRAANTQKVDISLLRIWRRSALLNRPFKIPSECPHLIKNHATIDT